MKGKSVTLKWILTHLSMFVLIFLLAFPINAKAQEGVPEFDVIKNGDEIIIDAIYPNGATEIVVPAKVEYAGELVDVTSVRPISGIKLVWGSAEEISALSKITFEEGIKSIAGFQGCSGLKEVILPNSVTTIGEKAFYNVSSLENIQTSDSLATIGASAFEGCSSLKKIDLKQVTSIGNRAFVGTGLTELTLPESVSTIGNEAFANLTTLKNVEFPIGVSIGNKAFKGCTGLTELSLAADADEGVYIGKQAFEGCTGLTSIEMKKAVIPEGESYRRVYICEYAFSGCTGLKDANLLIEPPVYFENYALSGITVESVTVKDTVESKIQAFSGFTNTSNTYYVWKDAWGSKWNDGKNGSLMLRNVTGAKVVFCGDLSYLDEYAYRWGKSEVAELALGEGTENEPYEVIDGVLFKKAENGLIAMWFPQGKTLTDGTYVLPENTIDVAQQFYCGSPNATDYVANTAVKRLVLPEGITNLNNIVKELGASMTVVLPDGKDKTYTLESIAESENNRMSLKVELPSSLDNYLIGDDALIGVHTFYIPAGMTEFPADLVNGKAQYALRMVTVREGNKTFKTVDDAIYSADGSILYWYPISTMKKGGIIEIPEGVKCIKTGALDFAGRTDLWDYSNRNGYPFTVILPSTLEEIEDYGLIDGEASVQLAVDASKCIDNLKVGAYTKLDADGNPDYYCEAITSIFIGNSTKYTTEDNLFIDAGWKVSNYYASNTTKIVINVKTVEEDNKTTVPAPKGSYKVNIYKAGTTTLLTEAIRYNEDDSISIFLNADDKYKFEVVPAKKKVYQTAVIDNKEIKVGNQEVIDVVLKRKAEIQITDTENVIGYVFDASGNLVSSFKAYQNGLLSDKGFEAGAYKVLLYKGAGKFMKQNKLSDYDAFGLKENEHFVLVDVTLADDRVSIKCPEVPVLAEGTGWLLDGQYGMDSDMNFNKGYINLRIHYTVDTDKLSEEQNKVTVVLPTGVTYVANSAYIQKDGVNTKCEASSSGSTVTFNMGELKAEGNIIFSVKTTQNASGVSHAYMGSIENNYIGSVDFAFDGLSISGPEKVSTKSFVVRGIAPANQKVTISSGNKQLAEVTADRKGIWYAAITLPGEPQNGDSLVVVASYTSGKTVANAYTEVLYSKDAPMISGIKYSYRDYSGTVNMNTLQGSSTLTTTSYAYKYYCEFSVENDAAVESMYASFEYAGEIKNIPINKTDKSGIWKFNEIVGQSGLPANMQVRAVVNGEDILLTVAYIKWIIDPSGYVYEAVPSNRIEGATATIYYKNGNSAVVWDAQEYNQVNPQITDATGFYAWDVPYGTWQVVVAKEGYYDAKSAWLPVPPPQLDVNLELKANRVLGLKSVELSKDSMLVRFEQYIQSDRVTTNDITLTDGTNMIPVAEIQALNVEKYGKNNINIAREFLVRFAEELPADTQKTYTVTSSSKLVNYCSYYMKESQITGLKIAGIVKDIKIQDFWVGSVGKTYRYDVEVDATSEVIGKQLTVAFKEDGIAKVVKTTPVSAAGKASIELVGLKGGITYVTIGVEGSTLNRKAEIYIVEDAEILEKICKENNVEIPQPPEPEKDDVREHFMDIPEKAWFVNAVQYVYNNDIMAGTGEEFRPNEGLTREQFVQVLYNNSGKPEGNYANPFPDVKDAWYKNAVLWANEKGIAKGKGNGMFGVAEKISRQDLALMLYKYAALNNYDVSLNEDEIQKYADASKVSGYAKEAMDWAITQGIMSGKGNKGEDISTYRLDPLGTATRAECASMMMKLLEK